MTVSLNFNIPYVKEQNQESISAWLVLSPLALTNNQKKKEKPIQKHFIVWEDAFLVKYNNSNTTFQTNSNMH